MFKVLQETKHHMKTGFGCSKRAYRNEPMPQQGSGQGNGAGPTLWTLISTKLIMMLLRKGHGVKFLSATNLTLVSFVYFSLMDNNDIPVTGEPHSTGEDLIKSFQEALNQ